MTPNELARELGVDPKYLRTWLRATWPPLHPHSRWDLTSDQAVAARARFISTSAGAGASIAPAEPMAELPLAASARASDDLLADVAWSPWVRMGVALRTAPLQPGVYMARQGGATGDIIYVGMAGERRGQGIRGRLTIYGSGKGLASGLGEAVFDRALADPSWLQQRMDELLSGEPRRAKEWGRAAFASADLELRWRTTTDQAEALELELAVLRALPNEPLWNRRK